ncbi:enoyl-CoA hydratase [Virgibacillus sp. 179-BFC.A HS]|uniref:Enoyl-CoA hydratase n=1 Tax=Tigheibacillus jepli TaxID=3035914 RepID=A0ABU5CIQ7_9BACI|nr:enoyl-CoA hydratase [Virgibacillus sp. 179-BFC.A HS]MDY0405413.1 enoyl-CoA hydratase [Virgibacillus sp. 179-BFC.A HS]
MLSYEKTDHIARLTLNNPPANALSSTMLNELADRLDKIEKDQTIKVVLIKGEGRFFCAGADIKEFTALQQASDFEELSKQGQRLFDRMENFSVPIIAAIHGAALGGGLEMAMACHIRYASENAKLGLPEMNLGIIPGFAGSQRLPRYVGNAKAYEMILSGAPISGKEAVAFGLVNKALTEDVLFSEAEKLASMIAEKSKPAIQRIMQLIPYANTTAFADGSNAEAKAFGEIFGSDDATEGIQAFLEKRKPIFTDK